MHRYVTSWTVHWICYKTDTELIMLQHGQCNDYVTRRTHYCLCYRMDDAFIMLQDGKYICYVTERSMYWIFYRIDNVMHMSQKEHCSTCTAGRATCWLFQDGLYVDHVTKWTVRYFTEWKMWRLLSESFDASQKRDVESKRISDRLISMSVSTRTDSSSHLLVNTMLSTPGIALINIKMGNVLVISQEGETIMLHNS